MVGDAELDEASNHEAIHFAGAIGLQRLTAIVIDNSSRRHRVLGGLEGLFQVADWEVRDVSGRDHAAIEAAFAMPPNGRPMAVIARVERNS